MGVVVGVDVGGSGLRCQTVVDGEPGPVRPGAPLTIGPAGLDIAALVDSVVPLVPERPDVLVWSSRGLSLADPVALMAMVRERLRPVRLSVCGDAVGALVGALGGVHPGAMVAAGTGAIAFATDFDRAWHRVDGWGHVLGDRGSSAWIGLKAMESALLALDGVRSEGAGLLYAVTERLGPPDLWPRIAMTRTDAVAVLAGLAPTVTALAATDPEAAGICRDAGRELARSLAAAASGIPGVRVSRTGGLFDAAPVREAFEAEAAVRGLDVEPPVGTGLDGAMILAQHLSDGKPLSPHTDYLWLG